MLGVPLGVLAAVKRGSIVDQVVRVIGLIGYSVPIFWLGLIALLIFYARLGWVEGPGRISIAYEFTFTPITGFYLLDAMLQRDWGAFRDIFSHIILPAALLGYFSLAYISRMTRSFMLAELSQEYIVAARAKGLQRNAHHLAPRAAQRRRAASDSDRALLCGAARRLGADRDSVRLARASGFYITNSLQNADMNAVLGGTIVIGSVFIGINLLSDLLYRILDPRTRER